MDRQTDRVSYGLVVCSDKEEKLYKWVSFVVWLTDQTCYMNKCWKSSQTKNQPCII